jgi:aerobic carbon-monoxide dehydrogenase large subunit
MSARTFLGSPVRRVEDAALLTGRAEFVDDLDLDGMLHVAFLRSAFAHARLTRVDASAARAQPAIAAVVTAAELDVGPLLPPLLAPSALPTPRPLLADGVVRFAGEPIALVAAQTPYLAEDAIETIEVAYEPLQAVTTPEQALAPGAPAVIGDSNLLYEARVDVGDVDGAFDAAAATIERTFTNPRYCATPMEPRGVVAVPDDDGVMIWSSTQAPHKLSQVTAELLGLGRDAVRVRCPKIGGGFGQKAHAYPEEILIAWLAVRLARPVKWVEDRSENLLASSHARDQEVHVRAAADAEGRLLAIEADVVCDTGAYGVYPHGHILEALGTPAMIPGPYVLENYRARSRSVATNKCPEGAYRGVGLPVSTFVHERVMDLLAAELGLDRAEIRRRNLVASEQMPYTTVTNQRYDSGDYAAALEAALEHVGYAGFEVARQGARDEGRLLGLGLCCYVEYTGINSAVFSGRGMIGIAGYDSAHVELTPSGTATVWTTLPDIGQGVTTTFAQMVADELGLDIEAVAVARADTGVGGLHGTGAFASRSAIAGGGALRQVSEELARRLKEDVADRLEIDPADLRLVGGHVQPADSPAQGVSIAEIVAADRDRFRVSGQYDPPAVTYPYATHACIVEVDPGTGRIGILRYVVVEDCGTILNPLIVDGQAHGAVAQGVGGALLEDLRYDENGQLLNASLMDYLVPTAADVPSIDLHHLEIPAPGSVTGAKGVGEGGTLAPPAALANAVSDALGVELNSLPLAPEVVHAAAAECMLYYERGGG